MRASPKAPSASRASASRTARRTRIARLGIALVPERDKVFPNLTVAENLAVPVAAASARAERRRREEQVLQFFPAARANCASRIGGLLSGGERQMLALGQRARLQARAAAGRRAVARPCAGRGRGPDGSGCCRSAASSASPSCWSSRARPSRSTIADYGYVLENGRIVLDGDRRAPARPSRHPGVLPRPVGSGERRSYRDVKQYRRSRRWYG